MDGHLVAVEVGAKSSTDEGMDVNGLAFHQDRLEGLDAQAVQGGGAVEQYGLLFDHLFQDLPDLRTFPLDDPPGPFDVVGVVVFHELADDKGTIELQGHASGQAALVQLELWAGDDDRAA